MSRNRRNMRKHSQKKRVERDFDEIEETEFEEDEDYQGEADADDADDNDEYEYVVSEGENIKNATDEYVVVIPGMDDEDIKIRFVSGEAEPDEEAEDDFDFNTKELEKMLELNEDEEESEEQEADEEIEAEVNALVEELSEDDDEDDDEDDEESDDEEVDDDEVDDDEDEDVYEDEDDEEEDEDDYEEDPAVIRRRARRKRRIRNQILAYLLTLIVLAAIVAAGIFAVKKVISLIPEKEETEDIAATIEALSESEEEIVIEAPEVEEEEEEPIEEVDYLAEIVNACISEMPIEDKVAQLFLVAPESLTGANKVTQAGDKTKEVLEKYAVAGFVYNEQNIVDREQLMNMISATSDWGKYRMFFAIDEVGGENGAVAKSKIEVTATESMAALGEANDTGRALQTGNAIGTYLKELGFNLDLAPNADLVDGESGKEAFGSDPSSVGTLVANYAQGINESGNNACVKMFPGLGEVTEDTHAGRTVIEKTTEELQSINFVPFKAAIDAGVQFIMVGHSTAENADDSGLPCSMSKNMIKGQLRDGLGYDGVVITDALNVPALTEYYTTEEICTRALKAGADILFMPDDFETAYNAVLAAVEDGSITEERIDESLQRIFRVKFKNDISE